MKKILFVINVDWYFRLHWLERAEFFKNKGFDVTVVTNFTDVNIQNELIEKGFECFDVSLERNGLNIFKEIKTVFRLFWLMCKIKPSITHCITIKPNIYVGLLNAFLFKKPIIYSVTGLGAVFSSKEYKFILLRRFVVCLYRFISSHKSRFVFENNDDYILFHEENILRFKNGIVIKGAGIDLDIFHKSTPESTKTVLFAARLLKDKGLNVLVSAKKLLEIKGLDFKLKVAGIIDLDVSSAIPLTEINAWHKNGDIEWLGNVKDMPALIKSCDIVCLPTTYGEGVPRILIEAASCQRAIIATNVSGCREIVVNGVNGLLAEPGSIESLSECLEVLLLNESQTLAFGIAGRLIVEAEFSQNMVFEKTLCVYRELIEE